MRVLIASTGLHGNRSEFPLRLLHLSGFVLAAPVGAVDVLIANWLVTRALAHVSAPFVLQATNCVGCNQRTAKLSISDLSTANANPSLDRST